MKINWLLETDNIKRLLNENISYEEIGRQYGVSGNAIKQVCKKKLNIELKKKRKINPKEHFNKGIKQVMRLCINCGEEIKKCGTTQKFCSLKCQQEYQYKQKVNEWLNEPEIFDSEHMYPFIRKYMLNKTNNKCEKCGWGEINPYTNTIPLEIHHIDGNCTNNKEENLQVLCPNCHALTETFGAKNKDSKRYKLKNYKKILSNERLIKYIETLDNDRKQYILGKLNDKEDSELV